LPLCFKSLLPLVVIFISPLLSLLLKPMSLFEKFLTECGDIILRLLLLLTTALHHPSARGLQQNAATKGEQGDKGVVRHSLIRQLRVIALGAHKIAPTRGSEWMSAPGPVEELQEEIMAVKEQVGAGTCVFTVYQFDSVLIAVDAIQGEFKSIGYKSGKCSALLNFFS
jgi:hypothetical protein